MYVTAQEATTLKAGQSYSIKETRTGDHIARLPTASQPQSYNIELVENEYGIDLIYI